MVGDSGAAALAALSLPTFQELDLSHNSIGEAGAAALASGAWPDLLKLDLSENPIGDAGVGALSAGMWPGLQRLGVIRTGLGTFEEVADRLHAVFPGVDLDMLSDGDEMLGL
jgi:hypothetical protein